MSLLVPERIDVWVHTEKSDEPFQTAVLNLLHLLQAQGVNLMSALDDALKAYAATQKTWNAEIRADLTAISANLATLQTTISQLQDSAGKVTPEDQAIIDDLQAQAADLGAQADVVAGKTPPAPPVLPPVDAPPVVTAPVDVAPPVVPPVDAPPAAA